MKPIAVTGASGFIGSRVVEFLRRSGYFVTGVTRARQHEGSHGVVECDYLDVDRLTDLLSGHEAVVHVAGLAHLSHAASRDSDSAFYAANVEPTLRVGNAARSAGLSRIILLSSAGIMGRSSPSEGFTDQDIPQPYDPYTKSKYLAELKLRELETPGFGAIILRPPMVYGKGAPGNFQRLSRWIARGWPIPVGACPPRRSVIGITNLCGAIAAAVTVPKSVSGAMLVADSSSLPISEFIREMGASMGRPARVIAVPPAILRLAAGALGRSQDVRRMNEAFELAGTAARDVLGWVPRFSTRDELRMAFGAESP